MTITTSDCQTPSSQIPEDEPEQEIDGYGIVSDVVEKTPTCRRSQIPGVVVKKIMSCRCEDGVIIVEKNMKC